MSRVRQYIDVEKYETFIKNLVSVKKNLWMNRVSGLDLFPRIVFAGLGEPTLHPQLTELVRIAANLGFRVQLVTNGSKLSEQMINELEQAGLAEIAISLHSLNEEIYYSIMKMQLSKVLPRIIEGLEALRNTNIKTEIWRVLPPPGQKRESEIDQEHFNQFISRYPFVTVLGPSEPWERDGTVPNSKWTGVSDNLFDKHHNEGFRIWCNKLYMTFNITLDGTVLMCCVDYHRITVPLGNVFTDEYDNFSDYFNRLQLKRQEIMSAAIKPQICQSCRRWSDTEYPEIYEKYLKKNLTSADHFLGGVSNGSNVL